MWRLESSHEIRTLEPPEVERSEGTVFGCPWNLQQPDTQLCWSLVYFRHLTCDPVVLSNSVCICDSRTRKLRHLQKSFKRGEKKTQKLIQNLSWPQKELSSSSHVFTGAKYEANHQINTDLALSVSPIHSRTHSAMPWYWALCPGLRPCWASMLAATELQLQMFLYVHKTLQQKWDTNLPSVYWRDRTETMSIKTLKTWNIYEIYWLIFMT